MNETLLDATLKVIIDGQAYLYAHAMQLDLEANSHDVTDEMFESLESDWKVQTAQLIFDVVEESAKGIRPEPLEPQDVVTWPYVAEEEE